ncbi:MAG: amylo-alpha-1,6-glucosidase [Bacteroidales bacterium]|nr:amylo-alpha-1,6-glucosidase [Bacteroidales bacterium]
MAFLKFNKAELVNLSYSLKREIICANKTGAYCNTSIVTCNTRRYHGLLALTLDRFGGDRFLMLSSLDESIIVEGKRFNLGIHCYGEVYEPRGHKYVVDFEADPVTSITYKIGNIVIRKSLILCPEEDRLFIKYELLEGPSQVTVSLRPLLAFRNIHELTHANPDANPQGKPCVNGQSFRLYESYPDLYIQLSDAKEKFVDEAYWNYGVTYSDEYRRGFDCKEDLLSPGYFEVKLRKGRSFIVSVSTSEADPKTFAPTFKMLARQSGEISDAHQQLLHCADTLITHHNGIRKIQAGYSWLYAGLLRETLISLPGLTLCAGKADEFEEILDNLIADNYQRLTSRTTQVEAPLYMAVVLQYYIDHGADAKKVWKKYGKIQKEILESYLPGVRREVTMHPNGLLWAQMDGVALSWMNAYINGRAVTERAGYQVETNALWYNAICFALEMEKRRGGDKAFVAKWTPIAQLVKDNYTKVFFNERLGYLADYVDDNGQNMEVRPNQLCAIWVKHSPVEEELAPMVLRVIDRELITARGLRTLSPRDAKYRGVYEGSQLDRDLAYHQGSTRPFLLAPYIDTCFRVKGPAFLKRAQWLVEGFYEDLNKHGVGAFAELYDGDPPFEPHGAVSSAMSTSALLVVDELLKQYKEA